MTVTTLHPALPDGIVVVVKHECETCKMIVPILRELDVTVPLTVFTQDDPAFPDDPLRCPTTTCRSAGTTRSRPCRRSQRMVDGVEVERTVGWYRPDWERVTGVAGLGVGLPEMRPGCGSMSVDPDLVDTLRVRFGASVLGSRRIDVADAEDEMEMMFNRGWTDGLPVVPPTEERVMRMLTGTSRARGHRRHRAARSRRGHRREGGDRCGDGRLQAGVSAVGADRGRGGVHRRVQHPRNPRHHDAGRPGDDLQRTWHAGDRDELGGNALGQGNRANSTIGRALQLVIRNVGGGRPGEVDRATHGNPGKVGFCFAENDLESPFGTIAVEHGIEPGVDALTLFPGEGPRCVVDQLSREPDSLARSLAACLQSMHHPKLVLGFGAILVMGPEHARVFADARWGRDGILAGIGRRLEPGPASELVRGPTGWRRGCPRRSPTPALPKFREGGLLLAYSGGGAGLFSAIIGGWANGDVGSRPVAACGAILRSDDTHDPRSDERAESHGRIESPGLPRWTA